MPQKQEFVKSGLLYFVIKNDVIMAKNICNFKYKIIVIFNNGKNQDLCLDYF